MNTRKSSNSNDIEVTISNKTIFRVLGIITIFVLLFLVVKQTLNILILIATAFFLALVLNAPVHWLERHLPKGKKKTGNRRLATSISVIIIVLAFVGLLAAIVPPVAKQTTSFIKSVPGLIESSQDVKSPIGDFVRRYNLEKQVNKLSTQFESKVDDIGASAVTTVTKVGSSIFGMLSVLVLTVMMLLEGPRWKKLFLTLVPTGRRDHIELLTGKMLKVVQGFVNGQVTLAALASVLILPIFFIMDVNYPIALMVIVFVCALIPMVGHYIGAAICTVVALFTSLPAALVVLGYYILYQQIENYTLQPKIQANNTNMSPLLVFIAVLLGGSFGGILGALVAIPVFGCLRILILDYLERRDFLPAKTVRPIEPKAKA